MRNNAGLDFVLAFCYNIGNKVRIKELDEVWIVWSDNVNDKTVTCLPYNPDDMERNQSVLRTWVRVTFSYDEVEVVE